MGGKLDMQRTRAPFIWTPTQAVNPNGHLGALAGATTRTEKPNRWFLFRKTINVTGKIESGHLSITADGRYLLYVNGHEVGRGPVRCSPLFQRYDAWDISEYLHEGHNVIGVIVHTYGVDTAFYEGTKGLWRPVFGEGGLWVQGQIVGETGAIDLVSDTSWRCIQSDAWEQDVPRVNHGLGFIEVLDGNKLPQNWHQTDFDDSDWDHAYEMVSGGGGPEAFFGGLTVRPFPTLLPSGIPKMHEAFVHADRVVWAKGQISNPNLPLVKRLYNEALTPLPDGAIAQLDALLMLDGTITTITTNDTTDISILLDFGKIIAGRPYVELTALGGEMIEIACSEYLPGEWDAAGPSSDARITRRPMLGLDAHLCRYIARPGEQIFERFEWCAVRWMQIVVRGANKGLAVRRLGIKTTNYPVLSVGHFECSDPLLTQLWQVGAYTLRMCMHDAWIDCPSREQRQWLGDATVESLVGWAAFGLSITPLNAKFLLQVAESQRPDGLTQMYAPGDHHTDALLIPDWTLQWMLNAANHLEQTGDLATIEQIMPAIQKALGWFERLIDDTNLLADLPYWHFMDWAGVGRAGYASALNAQLAGSFTAAARLADALEMPMTSKKYATLAEKIFCALHITHWDQQRGIYVDSVDPLTGEQQPRTSQHANAAMALWADLPVDRVQSIFDRITDPARLTFTKAPPIAPDGEELDVQNGVVLANTFYTHFVYEALAKYGRLTDALSLMRARFGPMLARGATTLWESFEPTASLCHAFSASPTWQLSRHVLGVHPLGAGYKKIGVQPDIADLAHARGVFPTARGPVSVELKATKNGFDARIQGPVGAEIQVFAPYGFLVQSQPIMNTNGDWIEAKFLRITSIDA